MKVGVIICCYNRPEYLKECLWSLERVMLPESAEILIIDDASNNNQTLNLINNFTHKNPVRKVLLKENVGIRGALIYGFDLFFGLGLDLVINFDSDAIIKPDGVLKLIQAYKEIPGKLLTGFHSTTRNANGTERHHIISEEKSLYLKQSVGGINFCIDKQAYDNFVKPALNIVGNWDHNACINAGGAYCLKESICQHIGFDSSMNHTEQPDVADDFFYYDLPDVTLLCVDSNPERVKPALKKCTEYIRFGEVKVLHPNINSKEQYSEWCIDEMHKNINTSHVLVFQHDGFVNNWKAWDDSWTQYDYIGAPWHYTDGYDVGNGGFSLRSKRLMELVSTIVKQKHPEDHHICRTYRKELEAHGMKFAPLHVAEKFSFEGYLQPNKVLSDQFGVHGPNPRKSPGVPVKTQKYIFNQFLSLGDILFLIPMARALMHEGNSVLWPIEDQYLNIKKHFPDINFVSKKEVDINYEIRATNNTPHGVVLPYRWASEILKKDLRFCMRSKYDLYGHNYLMWRNLYWKRDYASENRLINLLNLPKDFILVNRFFGHEFKHKITPEINSNLPQIEMRPIEGFTLIDWLAVVEKASEIHMANSSLNYLIELMQLNIQVHLYKRGIWGEREFEYSDYLFTNKCFIFHR